MIKYIGTGGYNSLGRYGKKNTGDISGRKMEMGVKPERKGTNPGYRYSKVNKGGGAAGTSGGDGYNV